MRGHKQDVSRKCYILRKGRVTVYLWSSGNILGLIPGGKVDMCHYCHKEPGTVQHYGADGGEVYPTTKWCEKCHENWRQHARLFPR